MHYFLFMLVYQQINSQDNNACIRYYYIDNKKKTDESRL